MYLPQCMNCTHFKRFRPGQVGVCTAYPDGIPAAIMENAVDHRQAVDGDHGVRWTAIEADVPHPMATIETGVAP